MNQKTIITITFITIAIITCGYFLLSEEQSVTGEIFEWENGEGAWIVDLIAETESGKKYSIFDEPQSLTLYQNGEEIIGYTYRLSVSTTTPLGSDSFDSVLFDMYNYRSFVIIDDLTSLLGPRGTEQTVIVDGGSTLIYEADSTINSLFDSAEYGDYTINFGHYTYPVNDATVKYQGCMGIPGDTYRFRGDIDCNGLLEQYDIDNFDIAGNNPSCCLDDVNQDGVVNYDDVLMLNVWFDNPGDVNGDGSVNSLDTLYLQYYINNQPDYNNPQGDLDFNNDGNLNNADVYWLGSYQTGNPAFQLFPLDGGGVGWNDIDCEATETINLPPVLSYTITHAEDFDNSFTGTITWS